jgi:hypothetical protein
VNVECGSCEAWPQRKGFVEAPSCGDDADIREMSEVVAGI